MEPTQGRRKTKKKSNTRQEIFVCLSLLIYSSLWMPLSIEKYPNGKIATALDILLFSFLSSIAGCSLFLVSILCNLEGYQKAAPIILVIAVFIGLIGQFIFDHQFCKYFFNSDYSICFIAEFLSFSIYLLTAYYLISMILSRTNFQIGVSDLKALKNWFGSRVRVRILLIINLAMLIIISIDIKVYSYDLSVNTLDINQLDLCWVSFCVILGTISGFITLILMRFQSCIPFLAHKWFLVILTLLTFIAFGVGFITVWKYRLSTFDGFAQIGNVFIWCVVNCWMLLEFMTTDINIIIKESQEMMNNGARYTNVAQTENETSETEDADDNDDAFL